MFTWPTNQAVNVRDQALLVGLGGSRSYGTDHPLSDTDYRGILIKPMEIQLSPFRNLEQVEWKNQEENVEGILFAQDKFFSLAAECNPNVIEILFLDPSHYVYVHPAAQLLLDSKKEFLSRRAAKTFCGYAMSQLKRIRSHKAWIDKPPTHRPTREEFGLPPITSTTNQQYQAVDALMRRHLHYYAPWLLDANNTEKEAFWDASARVIALVLDHEAHKWDPEREHWMRVQDRVVEMVGDTLGFETDFQTWIKREKSYGAALNEWDKYQTWLRTRNPARAELEARYGYDCKHAMHLVRLMRMAEEVVTTGSLTVYRPDREELIEIRNGSWAYDPLITWAEQAQDRVYEITRSDQCPLPTAPNQQKLEELHKQLLLQFWST